MCLDWLPVPAFSCRDIRDLSTFGGEAQEQHQLGDEEGIVKGFLNKQLECEIFRHRQFGVKASLVP